MILQFLKNIPYIKILRFPLVCTLISVFIGLFIGAWAYKKRLRNEYALSLFKKAKSLELEILSLRNDVKYSDPNKSIVDQINDVIPIVVERLHPLCKDIKNELSVIQAYLHNKKCLIEKINQAFNKIIQKIQMAITEFTSLYHHKFINRQPTDK